MGAVTDGITAAESGAAGLLGGTFTPFVLCAGAGLLALIGVQTWRLHTAETDLAEVQASVAIDRAARATAYSADSNKTAGKEHIQAATSQKASDEFTSSQPARAVDLSADLARAERLRNAAEKRAASYWAEATAGAAACSRLADQARTLDGLVTEGVRLVGEGRGLVKQRDAEVKLQGGIIDGDRALMAQ